MYTRISKLRGTEPHKLREFWYKYIDQRTVDMYYSEAPKVSLNPELCMLIGWAKTYGFQNNAWKRGYNPIGTNTPIFSSLEVGVRAHLSFLCIYCYDKAECPIRHGVDDGDNSVKLGWFAPYHTMHSHSDKLEQHFMSEAAILRLMDFSRKVLGDGRVVSTTSARGKR